MDVDTHELHDVFPVGQDPRGAVLSRSGSRLFVPNYSDKSLTIVDTRTGSVEHTVNLAGAPRIVYVSNDSSKVFVGAETLYAGLSGLITVDVEQGTVSNTLTPDDEPEVIAISPDGTTAYVAQVGGYLKAYDLATTNVVREVPISYFGVSDIVASKDGTKVVVANFQSLDVYDATTLTPLFGLPMDETFTGVLALDDAGRIAFVAGHYEIAFVDLDSATIDSVLSLDCTVQSIAVATDQRSVFAECGDESNIGNKMLKVDLKSRSVVESFDVGPYSASYHEFVGVPPALLLVADQDNNTIDSVDPLSLDVQHTYSVDAGPSSIVLSPDRKTVYSANASANTVSAVAVDSGNLLGTVSVAPNPVAIAISADGTRLYTANASDGSVTAIDAATLVVVATIKTEDRTHPRSLAVSKDGKILYVAMSGWYYIDVFDASTFVELPQIYCEYGVYAVTLSSDGSLAYATSGNNGNVVYQIDLTTGSVLSEWNAFPQITNAVPKAIAINSDDKQLFVGTDSSSTPALFQTAISTMDTSTGQVFRFSALDDGPASIAVSPDSRYVYAAIQSRGEVSVVDTASGRVTRAISGFGSPSAIAPILLPLPNLIFRGNFDSL